MRAIILAAGRGSRLGFDHPKILFPIAGRTILEWLVDLLKPLCGQFVFVLSPQGVSLPGRNATMAELAAVLQRAALVRPVVDQTGLAGRYDFTLEWTPDETQFGGTAPPETAESTKPGLFAAIQQLGLRLEATKGPIEALVINHVERPSEN